MDMLGLEKRSGAEFSPCSRYRYRLWRIWDESRPFCLFLMLNPSTADEVDNDPTVERAERFSSRWGFGGLHVCNLFGYRATDPGNMKACPEPVGEGNDRAILDVSTMAGLVVCAWGNHGAHLGRAQHVENMLLDAGVELCCLAVTKAGEPGHPLYLRQTLEPEAWVR